jgi:hypothetical protein
MRFRHVPQSLYLNTGLGLQQATPVFHQKGKAVPVNTMKAYRATWNWVLNFKSRPLYPRERTQLPTEKGAGRASVSGWTLWSRDKYLASDRISNPGPSFPQPSAILITLSWLTVSFQIVCKTDAWSEIQTASCNKPHKIRRVKMHPICQNSTVGILHWNLQMYFTLIRVDVLHLHS